jgi:SAM-dependent methyltransferase
MAELLIGAGSNHDKRLGFSPNWHELVTLDINPDHKPDVVWDLEQMPLPFPDNRFDEIHAYEVLEHTGRQGDWRFFFRQWDEFWRLLKPGGVFFATCPDWRSPWAWGDPGHTRVIAPECLVFLSQPEYARQVGKTSMTDYRPWYAGDFLPVLHETVEGSFRFALRAVKPARLA